MQSTRTTIETKNIGAMPSLVSTYRLWSKTTIWLKAAQSVEPMLLARHNREVALLGDASMLGIIWQSE